MTTVQTNQKGFTLIELLIVISIIVILAVSVFVALNPTKRLSNARDARRTSDTDSILSAIHQYIADNGGTLPTGLTTANGTLFMGTGAAGSCTIASDTKINTAAPNKCSVAASNNCVDLSGPLTTYLKSIPTDPNGGSATNTNYAVSVNANNQITVYACNTENGGLTTDTTTPIITSTR